MTEQTWSYFTVAAAVGNLAFALDAHRRRDLRQLRLHVWAGCALLAAWAVHRVVSA